MTLVDGALHALEQVVLDLLVGDVADERAQQVLTPGDDVASALPHPDTQAVFVVQAQYSVVAAVVYQLTQQCER